MGENIVIIICCCCCYWPTFREVCPNYEVVVFQPRTLTTPDLSSVAYCYVAHLLNPPHTLLLQSDVPPPQTLPSVLVTYRSIQPPGRPPSPSQHTEKLCLPFPHPLLIEADSYSTSSPPPRLKNPRRRRYVLHYVLPPGIPEPDISPTVLSWGRTTQKCLVHPPSLNPSSGGSRCHANLPCAVWGAMMPLSNCGNYSYLCT